MPAWMAWVFGVWQMLATIHLYLKALPTSLKLSAFCQQFTMSQIFCVYLHNREFWYTQITITLSPFLKPSAAYLTTIPFSSMPQTSPSHQASIQESYTSRWPKLCCWHNFVQDLLTCKAVHTYHFWTGHWQLYLEKLQHSSQLLTKLYQNIWLSFWAHPRDSQPLHSLYVLPHLTHFHCHLPVQYLPTTWTLLPKCSLSL